MSKASWSNSELNAIAKYNPHLWQPEELKAIFVARYQELERIVKQVTNTPADQVPQHMLITGNRGMGKSTLLHRVALEIEADNNTSQDWISVRFPEEQYTVSKLAELWSNILGALADTLERNTEQQTESNNDNDATNNAYRSDLQRIDEQLQSLDSMEPEQRESQALQWINDWCDTRHKRLLLLMDSSDLLFDSLNQRSAQSKTQTTAARDAPALWRLRNTLQSNPRLFWLGGSYQPLDSNDCYQDTFLDFFYTIELKPLSIQEMQTAMQALANTFGTNRLPAGAKAKEEIQQLITNSPERLATMHSLTGGNPRTTVILFELYTSGSGDGIRQDVERLLDIVTPLYKARIEALADQPRKLLAHILEHWSPITLAELHTASGLAKASISPQLLRLEADGLIQKTALPYTRRKGYQASERFLNIWYLMRNAPRRLRMRLNWLILFMSMWYSQNELQQLANRRAHSHRQGDNQRLYELEHSKAIAASLSANDPQRLQLEYPSLYRSARTSRRSTQPHF